MVKASSSGRMAVSMKVNGRKVNNMVLESIEMQKEKKREENG